MRGSTLAGSSRELRPLREVALRPGTWVATARPVGTLDRGRYVKVLVHRPRQDGYDCGVFDEVLEHQLYVTTIHDQDLLEPRPLELLALMARGSRRSPA